MTPFFGLVERHPGRPGTDALGLRIDREHVRADAPIGALAERRRLAAVALERLSGTARGLSARLNGPSGKCLFRGWQGRLFLHGGGHRATVAGGAGT